jgi:hypothetical protein
MLRREFIRFGGICRVDLYLIRNEEGEEKWFRLDASKHKSAINND